MRSLGAKLVVQDGQALEAELREAAPAGVDAVLDLVGTSTVMQSLRVARRDGRACLAGFLGGGEALASLDPIRDLPSGRQLSFFGSAFVYGAAECPLTDIPFQQLMECAESGQLHANSLRVFAFEAIQQAHQLLDDGNVGEKIVMTLGC